MIAAAASSGALASLGTGTALAGINGQQVEIANPAGFPATFQLSGTNQYGQTTQQTVTSDGGNVYDSGWWWSGDLHVTETVQATGEQTSFDVDVPAVGSDWYTVTASEPASVSAPSVVGTLLAGQSGTLTASVTPSAQAAQIETQFGGQQQPVGGTVTFYLEDLATAQMTKLGTAAVNDGIAQLTTAALPAAGKYGLVAAYSGDQYNLASTSTESLATVYAPSLYVADNLSNAISVFSSGASGRVLLGTIAGPDTGLSNPQGVALDHTGKLFVANASANTITEYAPGATGDAHVVNQISGAATGLDNPRFIALDPAGHLYVVNALDNTVTEYASTATGNAMPIATIAGSATGISNPIAIAVGSNGTVYVSNAGTNAVTGYRAGANGNVTPIYNLTGANTQLDGPKGITFNSAGDLVVANDVGGVNTYSASTGGNQAPLSVLAGANTGLANSEQPLFDPSNNTLLVDSLTRNVIESWPANTTGNTAPTNQVNSSGAQPTQMALNPANG